MSSGILEKFGSLFEMCLIDLVASTSHAKIHSKAPRLGSRERLRCQKSVLNERPRDSLLLLLLLSLLLLLLLLLFLSWQITICKQDYN